MKNKSHYLLILLIIIVISFPSICFSELKTVQGEYCETYMGDMKNKKELEDYRKTVRRKSIENGLGKLTTPKSGLYLHSKTLEGQFTDKCISNVISNYLDKVVVVSHTEKGRKICDKVRITLDPEVTKEYLNQEICEIELTDLGWDWDVEKVLISIMIDNMSVGKKETEKINIGLIIETKIPDLDGYKKEQLENQQEKEFFNMTERDKNNYYKFIDRRHLKTILEEQKLSSSGITDSETVKLGKILNLDIIVLRLIYENSQVTKVLKVDTGEVLLSKTYGTEKEGWIFSGRTIVGDYYYNKSSTVKISPNIIKTWFKVKPSEDQKDKFIKDKNYKLWGLSIDVLKKLDYFLTLFEFDCINNTTKLIQYEFFDNKHHIGQVKQSDPTTDQILPGTMMETLQRKVCEK